MNALPGFDSYIQAPYADDDAPDPSPVLDEMVAEPDCFDNWLSMNVLPDSVAGLLSLILDRGLPRNDGTSRDDELCDMFSIRMQSARDDFDSWACQPARGKAAPVDCWTADGSEP
jgi:hypothetical protein